VSPAINKRYNVAIVEEKSAFLLPSLLREVVLPTYLLPTSSIINEPFNYHKDMKPIMEIYEYAIKLIGKHSNSSNEAEEDEEEGAATAAASGVVGTADATRLNVGPA
jgi:hypothetical protein